MELSVLKKDGKAAGRKASLSDAVFGIEPNDHAIYLDVKQFLANQRQGTHKTKGRSEVSGSTRKLYKQKGTGRARAGDIKSPIRRGGGRIFGPEPRDYSFKLNKKVKQLARRSALVYKVREEKLIVLENFSFEAPKTKDYISLLAGLKLEGKSLLVTAEREKNVYLSGRNLQGVKIVPADELNTYDILNAEHLLLCEGAVEKLNTLLAGVQEAS